MEKTFILKGLAAKRRRRVRVTTMPVKRLIKIPRMRVTAKPRTRPEVERKDQFRGLKRIKPVMRVARLASRMESQARPKACSRATAQG